MWKHLRENINLPLTLHTNAHKQNTNNSKKWSNSRRVIALTTANNGATVDALFSSRNDGMCVVSAVSLSDSHCLICIHNTRTAWSAFTTHQTHKHNQEHTMIKHTMITLNVTLTSSTYLQQCEWWDVCRLCRIRHCLVCRRGTGAAAAHLLPEKPGQTIHCLSI
jgi:hypothetical protein